jgi:nucleoside-diphosphate-sugar epimerase
MAAAVEDKPTNRRYKIDAPTGVRGSNSDNRLIRQVLDWEYQVSLTQGVGLTYEWIKQQIESV